MPREFTLPDLGEGIIEAQVIKVLINEGDRIAEDQYLMEVETDKAAVEIPSPYAGIAKSVHVKEGQTINVGDVIVTFDEGSGGRDLSSSGQGAASAVATATAAPPKQAPPQVKPPAPAASRKLPAPAAPAVRKRARELGVDLAVMRGTGPGGRITKADVERHAAGGAPADPARPRPDADPPRPGIADTDAWGPIRREPISQTRKTIAKQMVRSAFTAVHVTHGDEADITELDRMRRELNEATNNDPKLTAMSFVIRATCTALRKYPSFNASFDEEAGEIVYKDYVNMGIAVDTQRGLIVPVIRNADRLSLHGIAGALRTLADRIRGNQFNLEDLRGGTFTITNVGALGGVFSTPIINYPEVAILALGRSRKAVVVRDDQITQALVLPVQVSFDHRATDGANAARFTRELISYLEHPAKFLLD